MEGNLRALIEMLKSYPHGLPLKKINPTFHQTYRRNLRIADMGFINQADMLRSLEPQLQVKFGKVYHESYVGYMRVTPPPMTNQIREQTIQNIIFMVREKPKGVLLTSLLPIYWQKFCYKLEFSELSFETAEELVESLNGHLFVKRKRVFHVMYRNLTDPSQRPEPSPPPYD